MERPCVRGSEWLLIYYWLRKGPQTLRPFSLKERKVRSPLTYMCLGVRSHMGWGIFSYSILASFPLAWDKITGELLTLSFPACMCGYGQGKLVSWVYFELKLAELFVSSEPYTEMLFELSLCLRDFFFSWYQHTTSSKSLLWNSFAEGDIPAGTQPSQARPWLRDGSSPLRCVLCVRLTSWNDSSPTKFGS